MALHINQVRESAIHVACHPRTRKLAIWTAAIFVAVGVLLGLVAPPLLRGKVTSMLTGTFHRHVSIEQISFNPYTLTATIRGFLMKERPKPRRGTANARATPMATVRHVFETTRSA